MALRIRYLFYNNQNFLRILYNNKNFTTSSLLLNKSGVSTTCEIFDEKVLSLIVCPLTKKKLRYDNIRQLLINDELSIGYKIVDGIPNMIPTQAVKLAN